MKKKLVSIYALFLFFSMLEAEKAVVHLGGKQGWDALFYKENIKEVPGKYGNPAIGLHSSERKIHKSTDLYLSFDDTVFMDERGNYTTVDSSVLPSGAKQAKRGNGAGLFNTLNSSQGLILRPNPKSFFYGGKPVGSFSIEFWLCPKVSESGSVILRWLSSITENRQSFYQNITAAIFQNKLEWKLDGIWRDQSGKRLTVKTASRANLIPGQWSKHTLSYDESIGLLEYRINERIEALLYVTDTGREGGEVFYSMLGEAADLHIGEKYAGLIDELCVTNDFSPPAKICEIADLFDKFDKNGGRFESTIIDTGGESSQIKKLGADLTLPEQTDAAFFIRSANNRYNWTETYPEWRAVFPGEEIKNTSGKYFQIAANLYPDSSGQKTPLIHSIKVEYEKDGLPLPPSKIWAEGKDGTVTLYWSPSVDFDVKGYYIYFGDCKGEYFSDGSPVDVGNALTYTIQGLKNGRLYFFTIAAYDESGAEHIGNFSKEVWARPMAGR
ncbi:hypothetical protein DWQ65_05960 [Treponema phagedenis]|uniref:Fibronectin type III domain protein n=1 Tax=Treponema phagedenis TaxID=162 RepID=A0A0B7GVV6_TREPH|nr:fibronectin type III domain-containing protein [Treponema phagedenis]EFW38533.1 fibronectin type III domain protein [Treponema phagedenis F0421]NVP24568.1 fibronectin type III domain-containing protein [Treponema phagedenis]QEJ94735.1 fibronectin type III domain-containing protein [Treponema phagedenis]QEJ97671.1 fibronectin type III domain-containing protein [Treponema phagedenis]QEK00640.1 fibronectin type III domain-containing protein [Treponema phagedenis]